MMQQQPKLNVETKIVSRKYTVNDDGSVKLFEVLENKLHLTAPQFNSIKREYLKTIEKIKENLSDKFKKEQKEELKKVEEQLKELKPFADESEKKAKIQYNKMMLEGKIKNVKTELAKEKKERKDQFIFAIVSNLKDEEKPEFFKTLTEKETIELLKIRNKLKKK